MLHLTGKIDCLGYVGDKEAIYRLDKYEVGDNVKHLIDSVYDGVVIRVSDLVENKWVEANHSQIISVKFKNCSIMNLYGSNYKPVERKENE